MKRKKKRQSRLLYTITLILSPIIASLLLLFSFSLWYQSRSIPDLDEKDQITVLPQDVAHVLGAKTGIGLNKTGSFRVPMFFYHYVENVHNDPGRQKLNTPPNILSSQIDTLKSAGFVFITPEDLTKAIDENSKLPEKSIILSFDDGYMDHFTDVFPILQKENVKAVFYVVPNFFDRPNYMFASQVKELAKSPLVEIGAHTMDHYALAGMNVQKATYEIATSRKILQNLLHVPIHSFAYPYGSFDLQAIRIVRDAGFSNAASTIPGIMQNHDDKYFINRLRPGYRTGKELLAFLQQNTFLPW